jgi:hypothetical protein
MEKAEKKVFNQKFVHFMWDDSLEGKMGIVADNIDTLEQIVEYSGDIKKFALHKSGSDRQPFFYGDGTDAWRFAYYDPLYEYKRAWLEGKKVQYMTTINVKNGWADITEDWAWSLDTQYRIKPAKDLRPFKDIRELKDVWSYKAGMSPDYAEPLIWVRWRGGNEHRLVDAYNYGGGDELRICGDWVSLKQLFDKYEFIDGTPCGVEFDL